MVGCLGKLGRSIARWMVDRGGRHLVFLSRSGTARAEAKMTVEDLIEAGAAVDVVQGSVFNEHDVSRWIAVAQKQTGRVMQGAMGLQVGNTFKTSPDRIGKDVCCMRLLSLASSLAQDSLWGQMSSNAQLRGMESKVLSRGTCTVSSSTAALLTHISTCSFC